MVRAEKVRPVTPFTRAFSAALRDEMQAGEITQSAVAERLGKNQSFVSERTGGKRPCDTDIIAAVAELAGLQARDLVTRVLKRMHGSDELAKRRGAPQIAAPIDLEEQPTKKKAARAPSRKPSLAEEDGPG